MDEHPVAYHEKVLTKLGDDLEKHESRLNALEKAAAVREEQIRNLFIAVGRIEAKVDEIKGKPGKLWESVVDTILKIGIGAILSYLVAQVLTK